MTNILIPTDFSENSWNAIEYALAFFAECNCTFYLLHVIQNEATSQQPFSFSAENVQTIKTPAEQDTKKRLQQLIQKIKRSPLKSNHRFFPVIEHGVILDSIRHQVQEKHISMIVMGTKGASGIKKIAVGSNTTDVISKVKCSALVIPEKASFKPLKNIALPTDYSIFYNIDILDTIATTMERFHASLQVVHLGKKEERLTPEQVQNKEFLEDYFYEENHRFHKIIHHNMEIAFQKFIQRQKIDCIAMAAKNIHFFQQLFFHSNSLKTDYHSNIPFLVLHEN